MFVRKTRHFIEFAFILFIVCILSFFLMKAAMLLKKHQTDDLEFNPNSDQESTQLLDDN